MNRRKTGLPEEIWLYIFEHFLTPFQLTSIRLVCRNWNRLVRNSSKLLDRVTLTIPAASGSVEEWRQVTTARYTTVKICNLTPGMVPTVPLNSIHTLQLCNPWVTARQLVEMLGFLPNLAQLSLTVAANFNYDLFETMPAVQLDRLECLTLDLGVKDEFLCIFQQNCPRLRNLRVKMFIKNYLEALYGTKLIEFIRSTRNTLEQVLFDQIEFRESSLLRDIAAIQGLRLRDVTLTTSQVGPTDIAFLCESQIGIEALRLPSCYLGSEILTSIAMHVPNLKELELITDLVDLQLILSNLPHLQKLVMSYCGQFVQTLDLSAWRNPYLMQLSLANFYLDTITLLAFFKVSPNIRTLKLFHAFMIDIHDVLVIAGQLKELRQLTVFLNNLAPRTIYFMNIFYGPFRKLRNLHISGDFYYNIIGPLLEHCPVLQDLTLAKCLITDNDMLLLVQFMKNLTKLCFVELQIGVSSGQLVVQRCPKLETLTIVGCPFMRQFVPPQSSVRVVYKPVLYYSL